MEPTGEAVTEKGAAEMADQPSLIRLVGSVLMEIDDERRVSRRYLSQDTMRELADWEPLLVSERSLFRLTRLH